MRRAAEGGIVSGGVLIAGREGHESIVPAALAPNAIVVSQGEQEAIAHNVVRYQELQKVRRGQPNTYEQTSYR